MHWPSWFDASHVAGVGDASGSALVYDIDTGSPTSVTLPARAAYSVANGHGAVAFSWPIDDAWPDTHYDYAVWDGSSLTKPHAGFAQAWSPDGSSLALFHQFDGVREPSGWVSVVAWAGLGDRFSDAPPFAAGDVAFDPSSRYAVYDTDTAQDPDSYLTRVVDVQTGSVVDIDRHDAFGGFAYWTSNSNVAVIDHSSLEVYRPDGTRLSRTTAPFDVVAGSADGSTQVFWRDGDNPSDELVVIRGGAQTKLYAPGDVQAVFPSPDGSRLVVSTVADGTYLRAL
ncbi:MAG TPA: hypothetical protein VH371_05560 [Candidatus Limnocylindrales bacterium]